MIHSFSCAGILPSSYIRLSSFAGLGTVGHAYIRRGTYKSTRTHVHDCILILNVVYNNCGYIDVVQRMVDMSMTNAVEDVKEIPGYLDNGEVCQL